ncbi:MAG: PstS family phosphate ABC transporter substrate-binding protein [Thermodesulfobacteriota bacterium]
MKQLKMLALALVAVWMVYGVTPISAEEISVVGTGAGMTLLETVAKAFNKANPNTTVTIPKSIGSGGGVKAVGTDQAVIGRISRGINEKEKEYQLTYLPFTKLPIVFFTHKGVKIKNLSAQEICSIYSGNVSNWKLVGGRDSTIWVVRREEGDSSLDVLLKSFPGFKDITITTKSKMALNDQEAFEAVLRKEGSIGFGSFDNAKSIDAITLTIDGKAPSDAAYPYFGTLALIFKEKNKTGGIAKFADFVKSKAAQQVIKEAGGLPY